MSLSMLPSPSPSVFRSVWKLSFLALSVELAMSHLDQDDVRPSPSGREERDQLNRIERDIKDPDIPQKKCFNDLGENSVVVVDVWNLELLKK